MKNPYIALFVNTVVPTAFATVVIAVAWWFYKWRIVSILDVIGLIGMFAWCWILAFVLLD